MNAIAAAKDILSTVALLLALGVPLAALAARISVPDVALFLLAGVAAGPSGLDLLAVPQTGAFNQLILIFGAAYLVFDGGISLRFAVLREVWITITALSVAGVLLTTAIVAAAAHLLLGLRPVEATLLGSVIASTDPATLVPILKQVRVRERLAQTVVSESACNDAIAAVLTFAVLEAASGRGLAPLAIVDDFLREAGLGLAIGSGIGYAAAFLLAHTRRARLAEFAPALSILAVLAAYLLADQAGGSGFMAVFALGVMLGNRESFGLAMAADHQDDLHRWMEHQTVLLRMAVFLLLGSQVDFAAINRHLLGGIGVVAVFMAIARPVTVAFCAAPDRRARWSLRELAFLSWVRETGVIPAALAGMLAGSGAPGAERIVAVTFLAVLATVLIQGTTTHWLATRLQLLAAVPPRSDTPPKKPKKP